MLVYYPTIVRGKPGQARAKLLDLLSKGSPFNLEPVHLSRESARANDFLIGVSEGRRNVAAPSLQLVEFLLDGCVHKPIQFVEFHPHTAKLPLAIRMDGEQAANVGLGAGGKLRISDLQDELAYARFATNSMQDPVLEERHGNGAVEQLERVLEQLTSSPLEVGKVGVLLDWRLVTEAPSQVFEDC